MTMTWTATNLPTAATFSKDPAFWGLPPGTKVLETQGTKMLLDHDRIWRVDWTSALGACILGKDEDFEHNLHLQLHGGWAYTLPHYLEFKAAEKLAMLLGQYVPGWSPPDVGVRWCGTGTDAVAMAVRLARAAATERKWAALMARAEPLLAHEGKSWVLTFQGMYHGWADWTVCRTLPAWGVTDCRAVDVEFGDLEQLEQELIKDRYAAVVFEHPPWEPPDGWWPAVRKLCDEHKALLIADEVVTGLRNAPGGACQLYGIEPDLVCMGKALGNGVPVAALAGRRDLMDWFARDDPVFCSSTSWGNALSLAAADHVLSLWLERGEELVARIWRLGAALMDGLLEAGWPLRGHPPRSVIDFVSPRERKFFIEGMMRRGHLFNRPNFPNLAMADSDVMDAIEAARAVRDELDALGEDRLSTLYRDDELPRKLFSGR